MSNVIYKYTCSGCDATYYGKTERHLIVRCRDLLGINNAGQKIKSSAGSPLGGKMSRRKNFRQSNWLIQLSPRKNAEPRIVGIRSTFCGATFFRLVEIRLNSSSIGDHISKSGHNASFDHFEIISKTDNHFDLPIHESLLLKRDGYFSLNSHTSSIPMVLF